MNPFAGRDRSYPSLNPRDQPQSIAEEPNIFWRVTMTYRVLIPSPLPNGTYDNAGEIPLRELKIAVHTRRTKEDRRVT